MWALKTIISQSIINTELLAEGTRMTFSDVIKEWGCNSAFRDYWVSVLRAIPLTAYCWETPPLTRASMNNPFMCVFVDSPGLLRSKADAAPFAAHFQAHSENAAVIFESLGKDAMLVAPCPIDTQTSYAHLAAFIRSASDTQSNQFWKIVEDGLGRRIGSAPIWLSTAGLGVSWLHIRMDSKPKYYRHRPYASPLFWDGQA